MQLIQESDGAAQQLTAEHDDAAVEAEVRADDLVEDVSIDGMCGVY